MTAFYRSIAIAACMAAATPAHAQDSAYAAGLQDRTRFEAWINVLPSNRRAGADYWTDHRSKPGYQACEAANVSDPEWLTGCRTARQMLDPSDVRRKTEPTYRVGWNSFRPEMATGRYEPQAPNPALVAASQADCRIKLPGGYDLQARYRYIPDVSPAYRANAEQCERQKQEALVALDAFNRKQAVAQRIAETARLDAERRELEEQTRAERSLIAARQAAEEARRDLEQRNREEQARAEQERAATIQLAAEKSPDNLCASPDTAKVLMNELSAMLRSKGGDMKAIDIEHLTTERLDTDTGMVCHGTFIMTSGQPLRGRMTLKKNIANEPIITWKAD